MNTISIILAAGKGTRFGKSSVNKNAVVVEGKSLVQHGLDKIDGLVDKNYVVVGHKRESVLDSVKSKNVVFVTQTRRLGTGHAVKVAVREIERQKVRPSCVLVANGDHLFMIDNQVIRDLLNAHNAQDNDVTLLTAISGNPESFDNGRIIRREEKIISILEKKDFTETSRLIPELNTGTYVFRYASIKNALADSKVEKGKELYITDVLFKLGKIGSHTVSLEKVGIGVNTKTELQAYLDQQTI